MAADRVICPPVSCCQVTCPKLRGSQSSLVSNVTDEWAESKHMPAYSLTQATLKFLRWFVLIRFTPWLNKVLLKSSLPSRHFLLPFVQYRSRLGFGRGFIGLPRKNHVGHLVEDDPCYSFTPILHEMDIRLVCSQGDRATTYRVQVLLLFNSLLNST